jgi:hypothetical protein
MPSVSYVSWILAASIAGLLAGLGLLARGLSSYRTSLLVMDTSTSTISSVAAGEVRITGIIEAAELTLVSLLQGAPCVYYHASIGNGGDGSLPDASVSEERSVGFAVRDATGSLRIFPRGARVDAPLRFHDETGLAGDEPPGLAIRTGPATAATVVDRAAAISDLLTVHEPTSSTGLLTAGGARREPTRREYREWRLEVGDPVTIVGRALPFRDLDDPAGVELGLGGDDLDGDPDIAADLAAARAAGTLADDPATAWGNAGIPGFGIGRPVTTPVIDPAADPLPLADPAAAASTARRFEIAPDALVIAASTEVPLLIAFGTPAAVVGRDQGRFALGLVGAGLAIGSALVLALSLSGGLGA